MSKNMGIFLKKNIAVAGGIFRMPRKAAKEKKKRAF